MNCAFLSPERKAFCLYAYGKYFPLAYPSGQSFDLGKCTNDVKNLPKAKRNAR
jgi:hypothetical protein